MARITPAEFKTKVIALCREHGYGIVPRDCEAGLGIWDAGDDKSNDKFYDIAFQDVEAMEDMG